MTMPRDGTDRLAGELAVCAHSLRAVVNRRLEDADDKSCIRQAFRRFRREWMPDLDAARFADRFAQTIAAVLATSRFATPAHDGTGLVEQTLALSPVLRETFGRFLIAGSDEAREPEIAASVAGISALLRRDEAADVPVEPESDLAAADPAIFFFERFLARYDRGKRKHRGVFYTPPEIVSCMVESIDRYLQNEFGLADGLADTTTWDRMCRRFPRLSLPGGVAPVEPFVRILDPAAGTGAFLVEVVRRIHRTMVQKSRRHGHDGREAMRRWRGYVSEHLLPRLFGFELMAAPHFIGRMQLVRTLLETGYQFSDGDRLCLYLTDTLAQPEKEPKKGGRYILPERPEGCFAQNVPAPFFPPKRRAMFTVILGNPPFSGISDNNGPWIDGLLKGRLPDGRPAGSYYEVDGRPLGERKIWLQDDYVKFIRFAQWKLDQAGTGILAFVSNHGYVDNPTFRGMRQCLIESFPRIAIVDLHGNVKKRERTPEGRADGNIFGIGQGAAIGLFRRSPGENAGATVVDGGAAVVDGGAAVVDGGSTVMDGGTAVMDGGSTVMDSSTAVMDSSTAVMDGGSIVMHGHVWGDRAAKRRRLAGATVDSLATQRVEPTSPWYFFFPRDESKRQEYERGIAIDEAMPIGCTAAVTARDHFVVAFEAEQLIERIRLLRDPSVSDAELRERFFHRTRSRKYPPGDTRGWKLADARAVLSADAQWADRVKTCWYRPMDRRAIYWADWMVDWPRNGVNRHLLAGDNVALVTRRQFPAAQPARFVWVADGIAIDGVIRSDNRGGESAFPLYLLVDPDHPERERTANFSPDFVRTVTDRLGMRWIGQGCGRWPETFGPEDLFHFIYAQWHSNIYRRRFAEFLPTSFPRVFVPNDSRLFEQLRVMGARLQASHLLQEPAPSRDEPVLHGSGPIEVSPGFPRYTDEKVHVTATRWFEPVPEDVWDYHVGSYRVCRKWLKDRCGRTLSEQEVATYRKVVAALARTVQTAGRIDAAIEAAGGWAVAFASEPPFPD